jgi:integrase
MARPRTGSIKFEDKRKLYVVRLTYHDEAGKRHDIRRTAETWTEADRLKKKLERDFDDQGPRSIDGDRLTFKKLADLYQETRLTEPVYREGIKIDGLRSWRDQRNRLKLLVDYFGKRRIKTITYSDVEGYKKHRIKLPTKHNDGAGERAIAGVHRELSLLRSVMKFARQEGWINRSPFEQGAAIISTATEQSRERILSREEEERLLAVCDCRERKHIRPVLIVALDTAARRGELLRLVWRDVDFVSGLITLTSYKGKMTTTRMVGMTARVRAEMEKLYEKSPKEPGLSVFGIKAGFYKAFDTACDKAGIEGFRFHDCRHTGITRMVQSGMPHTEIMKISGHTQFSTFQRYVNQTPERARRAADALDDLARQIDKETVNDFVN